MEKKKSAKTRKEGLEEAVNTLHSIEELLKHQSELGLTQAVFEPSKEAIARLQVIPLLFDEPHHPAPRTGTVIYDSWSHGPTVGLRDVTDGHIRRLKLRAGKVSVEIVAEMSKGKWEFVARVYRSRTVLHDFVLKIGRKKLLPESGGFFRWSSKTVPHSIGLTSLGESLTFNKLSW